jgi:peptidoglycan hydrolase-like protein with peptidoglycan-binding domain
VFELQCPAPSARPRPAGPAGCDAPNRGLLALQQRAGNRAVAGVLRVQRCGSAQPDCDCPPEERERAEAAAVQRLTVDGPQDKLSSPRYAGDPRLEAAFRNRPPVGRGERGEAVARVQQGLAGDGFALPKSTTADGFDGRFGRETDDAVRGFQRKHPDTGIPDGLVGHQTLHVLDGLAGKGNAPQPPPTGPCPDGTINKETDPLPELPPPQLSFRSPTEIAAAVGKKGNAPLGAHRVSGLDVPMPVAVSTVETGQPCKKCVADWAPPVPLIELFIGVGTFSDEKRFFVGRPGSVSGCDTGPIPDLLPVRKTIQPDLVPKLLAGEVEHYVDFWLAWQFTVARLLANVRRLTADRTHLTGHTLDECRQQVSAFLAGAAGFPGLNLLGDVAEGYGGLVMPDLVKADAQSQQRDTPDGGHFVTSTPPGDRPPLPPDVDTAKNPFGCSAFFRTFAADGVKIPGTPSTELVKDLKDPPKLPWHLM